jgi:hypothetical protein
VSYGFDAEHLVVWLDGFQVAQGASSGVLCRRHADAMVVPLSWMLDDRREPAPRLFRPPTEAPTGPMIRPRVKRVKPDPASGPNAGSVQLELDDYPHSTDLATAIEEAVNEAVAIGQQAVDSDHIESEAAEVLEVIEVHIDPPDDDATEVLPWQPVFDERDDLQGLLKARGRLLSRAFNGVVADEH